MPHEVVMAMVLLEHKTPPTLRIQMFLVVMLSGRVIDSRCSEGGTFLQISEINDPSSHCTTFMYKAYRAFEDALTLCPL